MTMINNVRRTFWVLTMLFSLATFVLCVEYLRDNKRWLGTLAKAVIALAIASGLHTLWYAYLFVTGKRHKASMILAGILLFWLFYLASLIAFTVLRNHDEYCPSVGDYRTFICGRRNRDMLATGWTSIGLGLVSVATLAAVVKKFGRWNDELRNLPSRSNNGLTTDRTGLNDVPVAERRV